MGLNILHESNGIKHITITGELQCREELQRLLDVLNERYDKETHITFLDANILPVEIINKMAELQGNNLYKFYVIKRYLYSYLYNLGIQCRFVS